LETLSQNVQKLAIILRSFEERYFAGAAIDHVKVAFGLERTDATWHNGDLCV